MEEAQSEVRKNASSLILVAPVQNPESGQPEVNYLITKRSPDHPVLPRSVCFPGGTASPADSSPNWSNLYREHGLNLENMQFMNISAHLPQIYRQQNTGSVTQKAETYVNRIISPQVSLRITAIRETFEECGILLCKNPQLNTDNHHSQSQNQYSPTLFLQDEEEIKAWQVKVRQNPENFLYLCKNLSCLPDLDALVEWSNWAAPPNFSLTKFDTIFYIAFAPSTWPTVIDPREVAYAQWTTAARVLEGQENGEYFVPPPQFYEMTRLKDIHSSQNLMRLAKLRQRLGFERWCPLYYAADHAFISCLPGDELYDERLLALDNPRPYPENWKSSHQFHRMEIQGKKSFKIFANIPFRFGQSYDNISIKSSL